MYQSSTLRLSTWARLLGLALLLLVGVLASLGLVTKPAHAQPAASSSVTTCDDATLRSAIANAASGDTISFGCSGTITLTSQLEISKNLTLDGSGQQVTLDGGYSVQVLLVDSGVSFTLKALTIAHGWAPDGGGLVNDGGTVSISTSTFANNSALDGGGLANLGGTVSISTSTFSGNSARDYGGGLVNDGTVSISTSTFSGNRDVFSGGGGLANLGGTVSISTSTFSGNLDRNHGGGLYNLQGTVSISTSTFASNQGYGIKGLGRTSIGGSIVAGNTPADCYAPVTDQGYNLEGGSSCGFTATGDLQNTDPKLASALASNGGPTRTLALRDGSPAINQIPSSACSVSTDQRGVSRPQGPACDMGAFEFQVPRLSLPSSPLTVDATSPQGASVTYTATASLPDDASATPTVSCSPASGSTFAIGTTTVNCSASDAASPPDVSTGSFQVVVKGAPAQVSDLVSTVNSFHLSGSLQNALDNKLKDVLTAINAGQTATACSELTDFIGFVQSHTGKGLTTSQANQLMAAAKQVRAVLGC